MAGLLSPEDASLMALGTGLLGGGTFAQAFGRGGQAALSTYAAMAQAQQEKALKERELAMQEELRKAQIQDYMSQAAHRKSQDEAAATQQGTINSLYQRLASPQAPIGAASSVLQSGANAGSVGPTMANAANLPDLPIGEKLNIIDALAVAGAKNTDTLLKTLQYRNEPQKREAGAAYKNLVTGLVEYGPPKLPEFVRMGPNGAAEFVPGGLDVLGAIEGTKTKATEAGKAGYQLVTVANPDGSARQMTLADRVAELSGGTPSQNIGGAITPELRSFLEADAMRNGIASPKINLTNPGSGNTWDLSGAPRQPGMQVQSEADKAATQARIGTEATTATTANKAIIDELQSSKKTASAASRNLDTIGRLTDAVDSGKLMLGPTATFRQYGMQLANVLGVSGKDINERLSNTRLAIQGFAQMALDAAPQLANQGQITENERILLARANSGNINELTPPELRTLLGVLDRASRLQIESHQSLVRNASGVKGLESFLPTVNVDMPGIRKPKRSVDDLVKQYGD